jgi:Ser/Thr protein kinase RdoA (MazF antagonist)
MTRHEEPLHGGRTTKGVVRIADTVHRPPTGNSGFVRHLLLRLGEIGLKGVPTVLGVDERGRDVFSFIEGSVPPELGFHDDSILRAAALLVRRYHDATVALAKEHCADVICHNDLSPCNFVFRAGIPVGIIDFDAAAPGPRLHDLGYAIWLWLDLGNPEYVPAEQARRLRLFADAYGDADPAQIVAAALVRQATATKQAKQEGDTSRAAWARDCRAWTALNRDSLVSR